jgi:hypothetical protein
MCIDLLDRCLISGGLCLLLVLLVPARALKARRYIFFCFVFYFLYLEKSKYKWEMLGKICTTRKKKNCGEFCSCAKFNIFLVIYFYPYVF